MHGVLTIGGLHAASPPHSPTCTHRNATTITEPRLFKRAPRYEANAEVNWSKSHVDQEHPFVLAKLGILEARSLFLRVGLLFFTRLKKQRCLLPSAMWQDVHLECDQSAVYWIDSIPVV